MATIILGSGATLKSITAESQLHELCTYLEVGESTFSRNNPSAPVDNVIGNHFQNNGTYTANFTLPVQQSINTDGQIVYSATDS